VSPEKIKQKNQKKKERKKVFRKWHRRTGFAASIFLFNLAITGILLNHYEALGLHKSYVENGLLLDWYDVKPPQSINCIKSDSKTENTSLLCQIDLQVYQINSDKQSTFLFSEQGKLAAFLAGSSDLFVLTSRQLSIYTRQFELIDSIILSESEVFGDKDNRVEDLLLIDEKLVIRTNDNNLYLDEDSLELEVFSNSISANLISDSGQIFLLQDHKIHRELSDKYRGSQISLLKLLQDLHSGQILKVSGKLLTDLVGIIIMLLALSGFITWQRRKNRA